MDSARHRLTVLRRLAVFASRDELAQPDELTAAHGIGSLLGDNAMTLIYDGAASGPIGTVVETVRQAGGRLHPIEATPVEAWRAEVGAIADGFVGLPGGFESLEAAFDVWTWGGPGRQQPLGLLDQGDYYSSLLRHASDEVVDRFLLESQRGRLIVSKHATDLLRRMAEYRPPETRRDTQYDDDD